MTKTANYTDEQVTQITDLYAELGNNGLDQIANTVGKTVRSVRAKLVREGSYVAPDQSTTRRDGPTKKELLRELEGVIGTDIEVSNFMGATKDGIQYLVNTFRS
jgi:hypothetical protein